MTQVHGIVISRPAPPDHRPVHLPLRDILVRVAVSLGTAVVVPGALFWTTLVTFNIATAVVAALVWMVAAMSWRWATNRRVSGLLLLTVGILTAKTAVTLATGNTFIYFAQPVLVDLTVATVFLGSLWSSRPVIARLAPEFYPMDAAFAARPEVCAHLRRLTLMWGVVILAKGCVTLWLLESLSTANFVLIKGGAILTLTLTAALVTIAWSVMVGRREGLFLPAGHP
jgi:intracellular septation protein A